MGCACLKHVCVGAGQVGLGSKKKSDVEMRKLLTDKVAGSRLTGSIFLCQVRAEEPRGRVSDPERLHRGSDSQQDRHKTLRKQMQASEGRGQSGCPSSEEGVGLEKGGRERMRDETGKIR